MHIKAYPKSLGGGEKLFTIKDILAFRNMEEATDYVVDSKVDSIMRQSIDDILKQLSEDLKYDVRVIVDLLPTVSEAYQRRNLLVHNDGIVNGIYVQRVDAKLQKDSVVGDRLKVSKDYLNHQIDNVEIALVMLAYECWIRTAPLEITEIGESLHILGYAYLRDKRYDLAKRVTQYGIAQSKFSEEHRLYNDINLLLARKYDGDCVAALEEARRKDYSGKSPRFRLALLAVIEDRTNFYSYSEQGLRDVSHPGEALREWPAFNPFREDAEFKSLLERYPEKGKTDQETQRGDEGANNAP